MRLGIVLTLVMLFLCPGCASVRERAKIYRMRLSNSYYAHKDKYADKAADKASEGLISGIFGAIGCAIDLAFAGIFHAAAHAIGDDDDDDDCDHRYYDDDDDDDDDSPSTPKTLNSDYSNSRSSSWSD
jgi:hypothetical protein